MESKNMQVFLQTRDTTCGVACMMMLLHYFFDTSLDTPTEGKLRKKLKLKGFDVIPAISLALYLKEQGLGVEVRHDHPEKFWDVIGFMPEEFVEGMRAAYTSARSKGVSVNQGEITPSELAQKLEDHFLIMGVEYGSGIKHALLLTAEVNGKVSYVDPLMGEQEATLVDLFARANMDVGMWYISVPKSK